MDESWYLDSGCSRHMTGNVKLLSELTKCNGPTITFGDNSHEDQARLWWDAKATRERTERGHVAWGDFCQQFQKLYFPPAVRQARSMELMTLRQGSMTIDQYQQRFLDLLPFSPHINDCDESKYDIFLQDLNQDIYSQVVVCDDPTSYETLVNRCRQVENSNRRALLMIPGQPSGSLGPRDQSVVQSGPMSSSTTTSSGSRGSRGTFRFGKKKKKKDDFCCHCGGKNPAASCRKATCACYTCGEQGHLRRDCPQRMGSASGSGSQEHATEGSDRMLAGRRMDGADSSRQD
ncbi:uncharacterized protein [Henckelia pumila]|uniref:uncharacterized protein n=1 Tax=Henckelia pumila TaxID=405737 RepID=UPI003C6E92E1